MRYPIVATLLVVAVPMFFVLLVALLGGWS